jgi:hypothetical protein
MYNKNVHTECQYLNIRECNKSLELTAKIASFTGVFIHRTMIAVRSRRGNSAPCYIPKAGYRHVRGKAQSQNGKMARAYVQPLIGGSNSHLLSLIGINSKTNWRGGDKVRLPTKREREKVRYLSLLRQSGNTVICGLD